MAGVMEPQHRFCKSADGTEIAYTKIGEGPPLLGIYPCLTTFETMWSSAEGQDLVRGLARTHTYVTFDRRGTGLSQRDVHDISMEAQVADLESVLSSERIDEFDVFAGLDGSAVLLTHSAGNPGRIRRMILWSPYSRYDWRSRERIDAMITLILGDGWSVARRAIADAVLPSGPAELVRSAVEGFKASVSPEVYAKILEYETSFDIGDLLPEINSPALILHRKDSRLVPVAAVRSFAARIPHAELILLDGDRAAPEANPTQFIDHIARFLGGAGQPAAPPIGRGGSLATVIFTDLVGHSEMMTRLGDERGREVLREHERITREVLVAHGGTEVKTMGDGFMASFGSVTKSVECAIALQRAFAEREGEPLSIRVGLNAGEPIEEEGDLFGATVILASRIAAKADGGEILVADTVRGLCSGKGFLFADRGEFVAKGFEEPVRVYEVRWSE
jgi:class 3 adenylate cyclase